ncbi:TauD/TfdA family dioxygenase [Crossiella sp. CA198]|uniref:TauD/TfdA family dioxygenase n=1 Tax=Crossiella sp. CA198 TaxID=3455607 RepID=UPI003F8D6B0E
MISDSALRSTGYALLTAEPGEISEEAARNRVERALGELAEPIVVFAGIGRWREIGVRTDRAPERSEGVGASPLHLDFVNAANPPDLVGLCCHRPDPHGGGATMLAPVAAAENLSARDRRLLRRREFRDGRVENLVNIGVDVNPFAVLDHDPHWPFRYTHHLRHPESEVQAALDHLATELAVHRILLPLRAGQAVLIDQHRWVHGKTPLGPGQRELPPERRRLLAQIFGRGHDNPYRERAI